MKRITENGIQHCILRVSFLLALFCLSQNGIMAQEETQDDQTVRRTVWFSGLPADYTQVGMTDLYYKQSTDAINIVAYYKGGYYSPTFEDKGCGLAIKVGSHNAVGVDCLNGTTTYGVTTHVEIEQQAGYARVSYVVTNTNEENVVVSLGTYADVAIGDYYTVPISRIKNADGETCGLSAKNGAGVQVYVLFGKNMVGVTPTDDHWFGHFNSNQGWPQMVGNYSSSPYPQYYMVENGSYDSAVGWCWKNRVIQAGTTTTFSYLVGVGEVSTNTHSSYNVTTTESPSQWNDLSRSHNLTLSGFYENSSAQAGIIEYAVDNYDVWKSMTGTLSPGDAFTSNISVKFDETKYTHNIKFRARDTKGNTTYLPSIEYLDVRGYELHGVADKVYTGSPIYQTNLTTVLDDTKYALTDYANNVNVGKASFDYVGVFPYSIGSKNYTFNITSQSLSGKLKFTESSFTYTGQPITPDWYFSEGKYENLVNGKDYTLTWTSNTLPGTATLKVTGKGNYTGSLTTDFVIDKAPLTSSNYTLVLPKEDITYDAEKHGATVAPGYGVGTATIKYRKSGTSEYKTSRPTEAGTYRVYLEFTEGSLYKGRSREQVGSFTIYALKTDEWEILKTTLPQLKTAGWTQSWDSSKGVADVPKLQGLTIKQGHVTEIDFSGQNISGTFPFTLLEFPKLTNVNLSNNKLTGDISAMTQDYLLNKPASANSLKNLNISQNQITGNIGAFASFFSNLETLNASYNSIENVIPAISADVALNLSNQSISSVVSLDLADLSEENAGGNLPGILFYDHNNQTVTTDFNLLCETQDSTWNITLAFEDGKIVIPEVSEQNIYYGENGDTLSVSVINNVESPNGITFRISLTFDEGDSNFDSQVDVNDLQSDILFIMENYPTRPYNFTAANLWKDESINVQDIICLVSQLLDKPNTTTNKARRYAPDKESFSDAEVYVRNNRLMLNTSRPVAAFDITIDGAMNMEIANELRQAGITVQTKTTREGMHLIGYSLSGAYLPIGTTVIGAFNKNATVSNAMLSDREANSVSVSLSESMGSTTEISLERSGKKTGGLYDLQGRKVNAGFTPKKGIYIQGGNKVVK